MRKIIKHTLDRKNGNFTQIHNSIFNSGLSAFAIQFFMIGFSTPPNFDLKDDYLRLRIIRIETSGIKKPIGEGLFKKVRKELVDSGYLRIPRKKKGKQFTGVDYHFYESPDLNPDFNKEITKKKPETPIVTESHRRVGYRTSDNGTNDDDTHNSHTDIINKTIKNNINSNKIINKEVSDLNQGSVIQALEKDFKIKITHKHFFKWERELKKPMHELTPELKRWHDALSDKAVMSKNNNVVPLNALFHKHFPELPYWISQILDAKECPVKKEQGKTNKAIMKALKIQCSERYLSGEVVNLFLNILTAKKNNPDGDITKRYSELIDNVKSKNLSNEVISICKEFDVSKYPKQLSLTKEIIRLQDEVDIRDIDTLL